MKRHLACIALVLLTACNHLPGQNRYDWQDVGHASIVEYGRVVAVRQIEITGQNTGLGASGGMMAGAIGGSYIGHGGGSLGALLAGAVIGGLAGAAAEQAAADRHGIEYTIRLKNHQLITVVQNITPSDSPLHRGERCMVQDSGAYQRVLPME